MKLSLLESNLSKFHEKINELTFSDLIKGSRRALGMKQNYASKNTGIKLFRLKNLETSYFRKMPSNKELKAISNLFDIKISILQKKATDFIKLRLEERKIDAYEL